MNHGELLRKASDTDKKAVAAIGMNFRTSDLDHQDKVMLAFAEKLTLDHTHVTKQDLEELRDVGFSDENILEIIASVAFRNFSNRLNVALGLDDPDNLPELDPDLNEMLGAREVSHINI